MRKLIVFALWLVLFQPGELIAQQIKYNWTSEFSPFNRIGQHRLFTEDNRSTLEWRNRLGVVLDKELEIGLQGSVSKFQSGREFIGFSDFFFSMTYGERISATYWAVGPYISKSFQISNKLNLIATGFAVMETGGGQYTLTLENLMTLENLNCPNCLSIIGIPHNLLEQRIQQRNINVGVDLGAAYELNSWAALSVTVNLFQFIAYRNAAIGVVENNTGLMLPEFDKTGNSWLLLFNQPILHMGMSFKLNR